MANRVTLNSANTVVIIGDSPSFKTTTESGFVFAGVRSATYGFSNVRADVEQIGSQLYEEKNIIRHPDVTLQMSYGFTPTFANEELFGFNYNLDYKPEFSILNGLSEVSNNFYFYNHPEQGFDGAEYIKNGASFPNGGEVVSIGNAYITNYSVNFSVGSFPTVDVEFDCSNIKIENYFSQQVESPSINLKSGNNIGVGSINLSNVNYFETGKFGDIYDLDRSDIETILPYDIKFEMDNLSIGGQKINLQSHRIDEFSVNIPINRANVYRLGSNYVCDRKIEYPIEGTLSISSLVTQMEAGFISGLVYGDEVSNLRIITNDCRKQISSQFYFEDIKLENVEYQTLVNEQTKYNLEFSFQISDTKGFKTSVTEQDIGVTRFIDDENKVYEYILDDVISNWQSGDLNGYKVAFGELRSYNVFDGAFAYATNINSPVYLPPQILTMGEDVFIGCSNLPSFYTDSSCVIPAFGERCFKDCSSLQNIFIPASVLDIGEECFMGCDSAEALFLADVQSIGERAFYNCSGLNQSLYIPDTTLTLGESAFENCSGFIGGLYIGNSLKEIKEKTFKNARNLSFEITIPDNISGIGKEAFYQCEGFNGELTLSNQLTTIEDYTFYNCSSLTGDLVIPDSVNEIKVGAFQGCSSFNGSLMLPNVNIVGDASFSGCSGLQGRLSLSSGIESIGDNAFMNCASLNSSLTMPSGVSSIGDQAFLGCSGITDVYMNSPVTIFQGSNSFSGVNGCMFVSPFYYNDYLSAGTAGLYQGMPVCYGSLDTVIYDANTSEVIKFIRGDIPSYWYTNQSRDALLVIGSTCKNIGSGAFSGSYGITGFFVLPEEVETIEDYAFYNCHFDGDLIIPDTVISLGSGVFENCSGFDDLLDIGDGIEVIKGKTFKNCSNIHGDIIVGSEVYTVEDEAFYNCTGVSGELFLGNNIISIGDYAFYNCNNAVGDLDLPSPVNYIGDFAFYNCSSLDGEFGLENVGECEYIGNYAFEDCSLMTGPLLLPGNVGYLGSGAFKNCKNLNSTIDLSAGEFDYILEETFFGCSGLLGELVIPDFILGIDDRAFLGCESLTLSITISNIAARNIGVDVFNDPLPFADLIISDSVETIVEGDFDYFKDDPLYLTMQEGLQVISGYSFDNYSFIGSLELPFSLNYIGQAAFSGCNFEGTYDFSSSNISYIGPYAFYDLNLIDGDLDLRNVDFIGDGAFYNNTSVDGFLTLNTSVTEIGEYTFYNCSSMNGSLIFSDITSGIGQYAFAECSSLSGNIYLPNNQDYTTVKTGTFQNCQGLSGNLIVHDYITSIEQDAFLGCIGLSGDITITNVTASSLVGSNSFDDSPFATLIVSESVANINNGEFDYFAPRSMEVVFQEGLSGILDNAFDNYNFVGEIDLPDSLTGIGVSAFENCDGFIGDLFIPDSVLGVGVDAFRSCFGLNGNLIIPSLLSNLGDGAFVDCTGLDGYLQISDLTAGSISSYLNVFDGTNFYQLRAASSDFLIEDTEFDTFEFWVGDLYLANSASSLGANAFVENYSFENKLTINENSETIGAYAFSGNSFTGDLHIPSLNVGYAAFAECTDFNGEFSIDPLLNETIGNYAFSGCSNLSGDLKIPETTYAVGHSAFHNMSSLDGEFRLCILPEDLEFGFSGNLTEVVYDDGELEDIFVVTISSLDVFGDYAFAGNSNLTGNLCIPDRVTSWGEYAFLDMSSLDGFLILGSGVDQIPKGIFKNCSSLKCYDDGVFKIPENINLIEEEAFYNCSSLNCDLRLKPGVFIGNDAFFNTNFANILVPSGTVAIVDEDYDTFQSFAIGLKFEFDTSPFTTIGDNAFDNYNLTGNLYLPGTTSYLGSGAFRNNSNLIGDLTIPYNVSNVRNYAFENCSSFDGDLIISDSLRIIGERAFAECRNLTSEIEIPALIEEIGSGAFQGCTGLEGIINLDKSFLLRIESHAFSGCTGISGVLTQTLPVDAFVGEDAFAGVGGIFEVGPLTYNDYLAESTLINGKPYFQGIQISGVGNPNTTFYINNDATTPTNQRLGPGINDKNDQRTEVFEVIQAQNNQPYSIPTRWADGSLRTYPRTEVPFNANGNYIDTNKKGYISGTDVKYAWLDLGVVVDGIGDYAFFSCRQLQGPLIIPNSVFNIGYAAFYDCNGLQEISLGAGLTDIEPYAFYSTENVNEPIEMPPLLETIQPYSFYGLTSCPGISFAGNSLKRIELQAFAQISHYAFNLVLPENMEYIGQQAFTSANMPGIQFGEGLSGINYRAFFDCDNINSSITLPQSLEYLGIDAFRQSSIRDYVNMPESLQLINDGAFRSCEFLRGFTSWNNLSGIGKDAFRDCLIFRGIENDNDGYVIDVPQDVYLGSRAFQGIGKSPDGQHPDKIILPSGWDISDGGVDIFKNIFYTSGLDIKNAFYIQNSMFYDMRKHFINSGTFDLDGGLTGIGDYAFYKNCENFDDAFKRHKFGNILIPNSVEYLGEGAFEQCAFLTGIEFQSGSKLKRIENRTFYEASNYDAGSRDYYRDPPIGQFHSNGYSGLQVDLIIPSGVEEIGEAAFYYVYMRDADFYLHAGVSGLGTGAFYGIESKDFYWSGDPSRPQYSKTMNEKILASAKVNNLYLTDINFEVFETGCFSNFRQTGSGANRTWVFDSGLREVKTQAFYNSDWTLDFSSVINEVSFGSPSTANPQRLWYQGFQYNKHSGVLNLPKIGLDPGYYSTFADMPYLESVVWQNPDIITTVAPKMFQGCTKLTGVTFPNNGAMTSIGYGAFDNCGLTEIDIRSTDVDFIGAYAFRENPNLTDIFLCNSQLQTLGDRAFRQCTSIDTLEICSSITNVGYSVLQESIINNLDWRANTTVMDYSSFEDARITGFTFNTFVLERIHQSAFEGAWVGNLPFTLPNSVDTISYRAFYEADISGIVLPSSLEKIGMLDNERNGFYGNTFYKSNLTGIDFSQCTSFTGHLNEDFKECPQLEEVKIAPNATTWEDRNFYSCPKLSGVYIPNNSLETMTYENFRFSNALRSCDLPEGLISMDYGNWRDATVDDVVFPSTLKTIGNYNWMGSRKFGNLVFDTQPFVVPSTLESMNHSNFQDSLGIQTLRIGAGFSGTIGNANWKNCANLTELYIDTTDTNATMGTGNFDSSTSLSLVFIAENVGTGIFEGTGNFLSTNNNIQFFVHSSVYNEYNNPTFSGRQNLPNGAQIVSVT
jgi:hypothetical protein